MQRRHALLPLVLSLAGAAGAFAAVLALPAVPAFAQDAPPAETPDQKAAAYLKATKAGLAKHTEAEAKSAIGELAKIYADTALSADIRKQTVELLVKYARMTSQVAVSTAAIDAFGGLSPADGAKASLDFIQVELKNKAPNVELYSAAFRALKKLADPSKGTVAELVEYLKYKDDMVVAKACDAMSGYKAAPGKVRKELFEELVKQSEGVFAGSKQADNKTALRKWNTIQPNVVAALQALSGQQLSDPAAARAWFNDNKKNDKVWN
jgi:hypothetical protein